MIFLGIFFNFVNIYGIFLFVIIFLNWNVVLCFFFVFCEGGWIDYGYYVFQVVVVLLEIVMFDKVVQVVKEIMNDDDMLLVVIVDYFYVFMMVGYFSWGNDILGLLKRFNFYFYVDFQDFYVF